MTSVTDFVSQSFDVQLLLLEAFTRFDEDNSGKIDVLEMVEMLLTCISFLGDAACAMETTWSQCMPLAPPPKKIMNMNMIMNMIMHHVQSKIKDISYMIYTLNYVL